MCINYPPRLICAVLIINLIGSLLAPSVFAIMSPETRVLLCTSQGYKWVSSADEQVLATQVSVKSLEHCVYCSILANDTDLLWCSVDSIDLKTIELTQFWSSVDPKRYQRLVFFAQPRAPPVSI